MDKGLKNYRDMMKRMEKDDPAIVNPTRPGGMMGGTPDMLRRKDAGQIARDLSLAFQVMKGLDPQSTVREGEMATGVGGAQDAFKSMYNKILEGQALTNAERKSLQDTLRNLKMKNLDPGSVVREGEVMELPDGNMVTREGERIFDDMGNIRDDAMGGMSMEDRQAIEALTTMGISLEDAMEAVMGTVPAGMVEGAVGATMGGGALGALPMQRPTTRPDEFGADRTQSMDMQKEGMGT